MGQFEPKQFEDILERMINRVVARTELTDINDGSSLKQVLAAAAREIDDTNYQMINLLDLFDINKAIGADLDEHAKQFNPSLITRNLSSRATGQIVFSRVGTTGTVTIPIGTQIKVPASGAQSAILFSTTSIGTILAGFTDSNAVDVVADDSGTVGNVAGGSITGFASKPSGVDSVMNPSAITNGSDEETDDSFRQRLKNQIKGLARAHVDGLETAALSAEDPITGKFVKFAQVVEDPFTLGRVTVYIDDGAGSLSGETLAKIGVSVVAAAVGGETVINLPDKPIKTESAFSLFRNAVLLIQDTDYVLNPASGQINFLPAGSVPALSPGDAITATYTVFTGLIALVQKIIDGDPGDRATYPGYRAAGVLVRVLTPTIIFQTVEMNITVLAGFDQTFVAGQVSDAISSYINGLGISDDVILNEIRERAMATPGVFDVEVETPSEKIVILDDELARITDANISVT